MITIEEATSVHEYLTNYYQNSDDPISPPGIKNIELLESAIARPFMTMNRKDVYPDDLDKAAALFHGVISNHCFHNGNKRTALLLTMCFLDRAGYWLDKCDDLQLFEFTRSVAAHEICENRIDEIKTIKAFFRSNSRKKKITDEQLSFIALSRHLTNAGFNIEDDGDYYSIFKNNKRYTKIIKKGASGHEKYDPQYIKSLRKRLLLTPKYGWDSIRFYQLYSSLTENIGELLRLRGEVMDWLAKI
ncbi:TPA: type II toxin-antitoxin system death-on-curing family toxin [Escherichia coli]|uniref:type II toxin-antitoxin system death-on-curing family toxin n=1 Tax=Escherichia coli TaxID=562 RepID=UPI0012C5BC67|nr:type II toxin-antitoxin system death-on-curing family toxin [Salmonella enterica]ECA8042543.1 type II toxin-antitoxin system death-on-curing family toxin [Salmonella enterica subsp. enterica serovar Anatum]ECI2128876.1 type II toxin-antitoxin system death-on-curing family toxin [Salmonella enterica subsp. enterica serovar Newport]EEW1700509.1 type II toxin-antitoxin system death-on-curing family toxin [Escherichia coli]EFT6973155.1 type II toxin-antitoxin system death-on-curing family toxin 